MHIAIAGAHGQIGRLLTRRLHVRGDNVRGLIRNPGHAEDVRADGGDPVVCDLEHAELAEVVRAVEGCDAVVFAAGAGPGSGPERKMTMDRDGAVKLLRAASDAGVEGYVMVSAVGAESPPDGDDTFSVYLRAKAEADAALAGSGLAWTIVRPGLLTDEEGDGRVRVSTDPVRAAVPRDDVAAVLEAVLHADRAAGATLYVVDGEDPVDGAVAAALG